MTDDEGREPGPSVALLVGAGLGIGALLGLLLARRAAHRGQAEIAETVEELRDRTQQVLDELSENVAVILNHTRTQAEETAEAGQE